MAESSSLASRQLRFDLDGDAPIPAAEVLIDLKESARKRNSNMTSPRKHKDSSRQNDTKSTRSTTTTNDGRSSLSPSVDMNESREDLTRLRGKRRRLSSSNHGIPNKKLEVNEHYSWSKQIRTFLRLPKALTWCRYEWFCSDIDKPFFDMDNDFCHCLNELFPRLKTRQLTRSQWRALRKMIGKPRRCSSTFFNEERTILSEKRRKVRELQQKVHQGTQLTHNDFNEYRDLPDCVPAVLTLGTRVTAWLTTEKEKGFYIGSVEAIDLERHQYRINFDKPGVGKHSVFDYNTKSIFPVETISLSSLEAAHNNRQLIPSASPHSSSLSLPYIQPPPRLPMNHEVLDPLLASIPTSRRNNDLQTANSLGGFPTNFLRQVVQMSKLLSLKQDRLKQLASLNTDAEKMHARCIPLSPDFQKRYATVVIDLDDLNLQLNNKSESIKKYTNELGYQDEPHPMSNMQECMEHASVITDISNVRLRASGSEVTDKNILTIIAKLTSILLQVEMLSQEGRSHDLSDLQTTISEVASSIHPDNQRIFLKHIETPLALIQSGMDPSETLHPFSVANKSYRTRTAPKSQ